MSNYIAIDHKPLLKWLKEKGKIVVIPTRERDLDKISKREAWVIFSQHWWTSRIKNEADKDKFISIDRLADITHAIGTTLISILFSLAAWAIIHCGYLKSEFSICTCKGLIFIILQILLIWAFCKNYWDTHKSFQSLLNSSFANMIESQFRGKGKIGWKKTTIYYSE